MGGGCHFVRGVQKAAVAGEINHGSIQVGGLDAKSGGVAVAQGSLIAAGYQSPGFIDGKGIPGGVANLGDFIDQKSIVRQRFPNRIEIGDLGLHRLDLLTNATL